MHDPRLNCLSPGGPGTWPSIPASPNIQEAKHCRTSFRWTRAAFNGDKSGIFFRIENIESDSALVDAAGCLISAADFPPS